MAWRWRGQQLNKQCYRLGGIDNQEIRLGPAHLIGHSYGALTALYMAYQHPELVRTLVLGEPPVMSLLEDNSKYSKDLYTIRENVQDAIRRGDMERAVRI